jgi:hypothetical protein
VDINFLREENMNIKNQRIELTKEEYNALTQCVNIEVAREFMSKPYLEVSEDKLIATNGRQLIVFDIQTSDDSIKSDCYIDLVKIGKRFFGIVDIEHGKTNTFPNWRRAYPDSKDMKKIDSFKQGFFICGKSQTDSAMICKIIIETGILVNFDFFTKILKGFGEFSVEWSGETNRAIKVVGNNFNYVLMPMDRRDFE